MMKHQIEHNLCSVSRYEILNIPVIRTASRRAEKVDIVFSHPIRKAEFKITHPKSPEPKALGHYL